MDVGFDKKKSPVSDKPLIIITPHLVGAFHSTFVVFVSREKLTDGKDSNVHWSQ